MSVSGGDFDGRLTLLESKIDEINGSIDHLSTVLEEAMKLFSHSESSVHAEQTERRFQSDLKDTTGIQSRYKRAEHPTWRVAG